MSVKVITATEFKAKFGAFVAQIHKGPVIVTSHDRPSFVAVDPDEFARLKAADTRKAYRPEDVPAEFVEALRREDFGPRDKHLDDLMS